MKRRKFLQAATASSLAFHASESAGSNVVKTKAPFRVLYSNDTTNITSCISPYHRAKEPFREDMLRASIDEVANLGVDAHFLQPGLGAVPMWPSKVLPVAEHYAWIKERYGLNPDTLGQYVLAGGDVVKVFVERCREKGQAAFISFRLNDAHHKEYAQTKSGEKVPGSVAMSVTRFYAEHPEYCINPASKRGADLVQNWAIPEVRAQKMALLTELCENYDLDGLELDFMRFYSFFAIDQTSREERCAIMTRFVNEVRGLLDRTERAGKRRWLCIRIPCYIRGFDALGIDLSAMTKAGVNMINLSASYFTVQQNDLAKIRRMVPETSIYLELCHSIWNGDKLVAGYDTFTFRRTTPQQYFTAAHLAYARGADGVSAFNFAYYREHGSAGRGPFHEPPFEIFAKLQDREWLAQQPQHYFLAPGWNNPFIRPPLLPRKVLAGKATLFDFDLAPPKGGWKKEGRLRLQTSAAMTGNPWEISFNGHKLEPSEDVSEPYENPYPSLLGRPEEIRAWKVPADVLRDDFNRIEARSTSETEHTVTFVDLAIH